MDTVNPPQRRILTGGERTAGHYISAAPYPFEERRSHVATNMTMSGFATEFLMNLQDEIIQELREGVSDDGQGVALFRASRELLIRQLRALRG